MSKAIKIGNKISWFLGNISYEIYLSHHIAFYLVKEILPNVNSGIFILISLLVTILISILINLCSSKINCVVSNKNTKVIERTSVE